jgi:imidazolonepropionase-like amidohydrolase
MRPKAVSLALPLLALAACVHAPASPTLATSAGPAKKTLIHDVRVFPATSTAVLEHQDVWLEDGLITRLEPSGGPVPGGVTVVSGAGKTLLPGFVDLHAHFVLSGAPPWYLALPNPDHAAQATVYAGVTTALDAGGNADELLALRLRIARGEVAGPRLFFSGPHLTVPDGYPLSMLKALYGPLAAASVAGVHSLAVASEDELLRRVDESAARGARFVKLMVASVPPGAPKLPDAWVTSAVRRAHVAGLKVLAHIDSAEDARVCAAAGVDLLAHDVVTSALTDADVQALAASGIAMEPTLVNWERSDEIAAGHYQGSELERQCEPTEILASLSDADLARALKGFEATSFKPWGDALAKHRADRATNVKKLAAAGVPILVGSDANGSLATFAGAYHDELALQVAAGLAPAQVLLAATAKAARFLDPQARFGTVEPGKAADLVLVEGDPLQDIRVTRRIVDVFVGGRRLVRTAAR